MKHLPHVGWVALMFLARLLPVPFLVTPIVGVLPAAGHSMPKAGIIGAVMALIAAEAVLGFSTNTPLIVAYFLALYLTGRAGGLKRVATGSAATVFGFFLLSNGLLWYGSAFYPQTAIGLATALAAGLPFLGGQLLGLAGGLIYIAYREGYLTRTYAKA